MLKDFLKIKGLSQRRVARAHGFSKQQISKWVTKGYVIDVSLKIRPPTYTCQLDESLINDLVEASQKPPE